MFGPGFACSICATHTHSAPTCLFVLARATCLFALAQMPRLHLPATKARAFKLRWRAACMRKKSAGKADVVFLASLPCVPAQNAIHARQACKARTHARPARSARKNHQAGALHSSMSLTLQQMPPDSPVSDDSDEEVFSRRTGGFVRRSAQAKNAQFWEAAPGVPIFCISGRRKELRYPTPQNYTTLN